MNILYLIVGGILGTLARYFVSGVVYRVAGTTFPYGTFVVNLLGCFIIGFIVSLVEQEALLDNNLKLLLMAGFCGAFTTFSAFIFEADNLIKNGEFLKAAGYVFGSLILGFILYRSGAFLAKII